MIRNHAWRAVLCALTFLPLYGPSLLGTLPGVPVASAQEAPMIAVDTPTGDESIPSGQSASVTGWAADWAGRGPGIDTVEVYLGDPAAGGVFLGVPAGGLPRPDVAGAYGRPDWANAGYELPWNLAGLAPGSYTLYVYAHSMVTDSWALQTRSVRVIAPAAVAPPSDQGMFAPPPGYGAPPGLGVYPGGLPIGLGAVVPIVADADGTFSLNWVPRQEAREYRIYRSSTGSLTGMTLVRTVSQSSGQIVSSATIGGLTPGLTYLFEVRAVDNSGFESFSPSGPDLVGGYYPTTNAVADAGGAVFLDWMPIPNAQSYRVYRSSAGGAGAMTLANTVNQSGGIRSVRATITGLRPSESYAVQVRAVDGTGQERLVPVSGVGSGITDITLPPNSLVVAGVATNTISLYWSSSPTGSNTRVYQSSSGASGSFGHAVLTGPTVRSGTVTGLQPGTTYWFYVTSVNATGLESAPSNLVSAVTLIQ